ncbi:MAG: hypothetical protein K0Q72_4893 [Armatimonadetes bacterium]|jgi:hypothetical protein|nr:hypothetical protein [Armatimonadota bacterium]
MFRLPFGRRAEGPDTDALRDDEGIWSLPDMEAAPDSDPHSQRDLPSFRYEEHAAHPEGVFTAELAGWRPLDSQRAVWQFRVVRMNDYEPWSPELLPFVTSTTYRPDNNLGRLASALGLVSGVATPEDLQRPEARSAVRGAITALDPDQLIGRQCRIVVEHLRDEVGDVAARVKTVAPLGQI